MKLKTSMFKKDPGERKERDLQEDARKILAPREETSSKKDTLGLEDKLGLFFNAPLQLNGDENDVKRFYNHYLTKYGKRNRTRRPVLNGLPTGGSGDDF